MRERGRREEWERGNTKRNAHKGYVYRKKQKKKIIANTAVEVRERLRERI